MIIIDHHWVGVDRKGDAVIITNQHHGMDSAYKDKAALLLILVSAFMCS